MDLQSNTSSHVSSRSYNISAKDNNYYESLSVSYITNDILYFVFQETAHKRCEQVPHPALHCHLLHAALLPSGHWADREQCRLHVLLSDDSVLHRGVCGVDGSGVHTHVSEACCRVCEHYTEIHRHRFHRMLGWDSSLLCTRKITPIRYFLIQFFIFCWGKASTPFACIYQCLYNCPLILHYPHYGHYIGRQVIQ